MRLTLTIPGRLTQDVDSFEAASAAYAQARDLSGEGASSFPFGTVERDGVTIATVSYNGRIWDTAQTQGKGADHLLFDPSGKLPVDQSAIADIAWAPGEAEAIVRALEPGLRAAAAKAWAEHPNNPANRA